METSNSSRMLAVPEVFSRPEAQACKVLRFGRGEFVFRQGDVADAIYFILMGRVQLSVTSFDGKEATFAVLGPHELFGEQCLLCGQQRRVVSARAANACDVVRVELKKVLDLLERDIAFAIFFLRQIISRIGHYEQALVHHIMNNAERRLARELLHLAHYESEGAKPKLIEGVSQELLAEIVGASRPRISGFMNKFRRLGYIDYSGNHIVVNPSLLSVLFQQSPAPQGRRATKTSIAGG